MLMDMLDITSLSQMLSCLHAGLIIREEKLFEKECRKPYDFGILFKTSRIILSRILLSGNTVFQKIRYFGIDFS